MSYIIETQEDENGDLFITFPEDLMEELDWREGDLLDWTLKGSSIILSRVSDPALYEVIEE